MNKSLKTFAKIPLLAVVTVENTHCMERLKYSSDEVSIQSLGSKSSTVPSISVNTPFLLSAQANLKLTITKNEINFMITPDKINKLSNAHNNFNNSTKFKHKNTMVFSNKDKIINKTEDEGFKQLKALFTNAQIDLIKTLNSASVFKSSKLICIKKIVNDLDVHKKMLLNGCPNSLKYRTFSEINIPLESKLEKSVSNSVVLSKSDLEKLGKIATFFTNKPKNNKGHKLGKYWRISPDYDMRSPSLSFTPLPKLLDRKKPHLSDKELSLFMACIKTDLLVNPYVRGIDVSLNTRMLFNYSINCRNYGNDLSKKITSYQKHLSKDQNLILTSQLISVYLQKNSPEKYKNYVTLLAADALFKMDRFDTKKLLKNEYQNKYTNLFQYFFRKQISLPAQYDENVNNFSLDILRTPIVYKIPGCSVDYKTTIERLLHSASYIPLLVTFRSIQKKLDAKKAKDYVNTVEEKPLNKIYESFVQCMNIGNYKLSLHKLLLQKQHDIDCFPLNVLTYLNSFDTFKLYSVFKIQLALFDDFCLFFNKHQCKVIV